MCAHSRGKGSKKAHNGVKKTPSERQKNPIGASKKPHGCFAIASAIKNMPKVFWPAEFPANALQNRRKTQKNSMGELKKPYDETEKTLGLILLCFSTGIKRRARPGVPRIFLR